jgi:Flp pilus assembly protein TadG
MSVMTCGLSQAKRTRLSHVDSAPRRARRSERGVAMVEAAFVTPLFILLLFAVIEFGLAMKDYIGVGNAVRAGARTASTEGNDTYADYFIVQAVAKNSTALSRSDIQYVVVYKASAIGGKPDATCMAGTAHTSSSGTTPCNVYTPSNFSTAETGFGCGTTEPDRFWCPNTRVNALGGTGPDFVGVWMKMQHKWVTKMFGTAQTLTDQSVIRIEPATE